MPNKRTAEQAAAIAESGLTPLEFMLSVMRDEDQETSRRIEAAKSAAPYCHARLTAVELSGNIGLTHEQWLEQLG